ncbi:hypothetical protein [Nonomuraea sp. NPDC002799]
MNRETRRLRDRVDDLEERLDQIRGVLDVIDDERLAAAIAHTPEGGKLHQALANIHTLAGPGRALSSTADTCHSGAPDQRKDHR